MDPGQAPARRRLPRDLDLDLGEQEPQRLVPPLRQPQPAGGLGETPLDLALQGLANAGQGRVVGVEAPVVRDQVESESDETGAVARGGTADAGVLAHAST